MQCPDYISKSQVSMAPTALLFPEAKNLTLYCFRGYKGIIFLLGREKRTNKLKTLHFSHSVLIPLEMEESFWITVKMSYYTENHFFFLLKINLT